MYKSILVIIFSLIASFSTAHASEVDRIYSESNANMVRMFQNFQLPDTEIRNQARLLGIPDSTPIAVIPDAQLAGPASSGDTIYLPKSLLAEAAEVKAFVLLHEYHHILRQDVKSVIANLVTQHPTADKSTLHLVELFQLEVTPDFVKDCHTKEYAADKFAIDMLIPLNMLDPEKISDYLLRLNGNDGDAVTAFHPSINSRVALMRSSLRFAVQMSKSHSR